MRRMIVGFVSFLFPVVLFGQVLLHSPDSICVKVIWTGGQGSDRMDSVIVGSGSSVLNVLGMLPGVIIDSGGHTVSLRGEVFTIQINGRLVRKPAVGILSMLKGIQADTVERIQLSAPDSGKGAGSINIIFKNSEEMGTAGSFSVSGGWGMYPKAGIGVDIYNRSGPLTVYGGYNYSYAKTYSEITAHGGFQFPMDEGERTYYYHNEMWPERRRSSINAGLNYEPDKRTIIGFNTIISGIYEKNNGFMNGDYTLYGDSALLLRSNKQEKNNVSSVINNLNIERAIGSGSKLAISMDYITHKDFDTSTYLNSFLTSDRKNIANQSSFFFPQRDVMNRSTVDIQAYKVEFDRKEGANVTWGVGSKISRLKFTDYRELTGLKDGISYQDDVFSGVNRNHESKKSAYSSLNINVSRTTIAIGMRYEWISSELVANSGIKAALSREYRNFLPSFTIRKELSANANVKLSYNRDMRMPSQNDISPPISYSDIYALTVGNPYLKPAISDRMEADFQWKKMSLEVAFNRENHTIVGGQPSKGATDSIIYDMTHNFKYSQSLRFRLSFPIPIASWYRTYIRGTAAWNEYKTEVLPAFNFIDSALTNRWFNYTLACTQIFTLPKAISIGLSAWYTSASWWGVYRGNGLGAVELEVEKGLSGRASIKISFENLLMSGADHSHFEIPDQIYHIHSNWFFYREGQKAFLVNLTYSKSFGGSKVKAPRRWEMAAQEECGRIIDLY
jgi:iron complex outermembrane receptor protein